MAVTSRAYGGKVSGELPATSAGFSVSAGLAPAAGHVPQLFQFSNPFMDMFHRHSNQPAPTSTTSSVAGGRMSAVPSSEVGRVVSPVVGAAQVLPGSASPEPSFFREGKSFSSPKVDTMVMTQTYSKGVEARAVPQLATDRDGGKGSAASPGRPASGGPGMRASSSPHGMSSDKALLSNVCDVCGAAFPAHHQLVQHRNVHFHGHQKQKLQCSVCDKTFLSEGLLKRHQMADGHLPSAVVKAPSMPGQRSDDEREEEEGERVGATSLNCSFCSSAFDGQEELSNHLRSKQHISRLEMLGMLPVGTYQRLSEDQLSPEKPHAKPSPPLKSISVSHDAALMLDRHFSAAREVLKASGNAEALSKISSSCVPKTGTPVRDILSSLRKGEGKVDTANAASSVVTLVVPRAVEVEQRSDGGEQKGEGGLDAPRAGVKRCAAALDDEDDPHVTGKLLLKEPGPPHSEERSRLALTKKPKLQNAVLHSIDSDLDGDLHLVIDEGQGDATRSKTPEPPYSSVAPASSAAALPQGVGGVDDKEKTPGGMDRIVKPDLEQAEAEDVVSSLAGESLAGLL